MIRSNNKSSRCDTAEDYDEQGHAQAAGSHLAGLIRHSLVSPLLPLQRKPFREEAVMDLDEDGVSKTCWLRGYDPVTVAASLQLRLPFNMIQSTSSSSSTSAPILLHRRLSLLEALNNSIQDEDCSPFESSSKASMASCSMDSMAERIYSVKQILQRNNDLLTDRGRMSMRVPRIYVRNSREEQTQEVPCLVRSRTTKRSKSQPNHSNSSQDSDYEYDSSAPSHVSRVECEESSVWPRGCRCSMQSTSSSLGSRSTASSNDSGIVLAEASWDHVALLPDELPFASGDVITVLDSSSQSGLWYGSCGDSQGWFPASHVRLLSSSQPSRPTSTNAVAEWEPQQRQRRARVVEELMHTERDYVRLLEDIVHGFLEQTRRRSELFGPNRVRNIFGNLHQIYVIHSKLLRELEMALDQQNPENSNLGASFLRNKHSFTIYSEYCNNRPVSCAELATLSRLPLYRQFFEACRLLRGMPNLSLEGFLLTPVQRICRYPLQLAELLKATPSWHDDYPTLDAAERAMRGVAAAINDRKKRIETLQDIARWQRTVHGWRGPDLLENNSAMLKSGEVSGRYLINGGVQWTKDVLLFMFDQAIVVCKKDLLKKNFYIFKDRMSLESVTLVDCKDGKEPSFGVSVKNSFKLVGSNRQYLFTCPDKKSKAAWKAAFETRLTRVPTASAEERRLALAALNSANSL